jgi:hypothetical protein
LTEKRLDHVQNSHYGHARLDSRTLRILVSRVLLTPSAGRNVSLPDVGQLHLWRTESDDATPNVSVHLLCSQR